MNQIKIWSPRWHDRKVLIAKYKVQSMNEIVFTKGTLKDKRYSLSGAEIVRHPIESNGTISCYAVPLEVVMGEKNS